jgi:2-hydroxy-3-oxopropionate reductase
MDKQRIGFVGLGLMGKVMAGNLVSAGFPVIGFDIDQAKIDAFVKAGGEAIRSGPDHLAARVDVIVLSLPNSRVVDDAVRKTLRLFETGRKGLILIDMTTADPMMSAALATELREKGMEMLDATISGGPKLLAERDVTLMIGGQEEIFQSCQSIFSAIAKDIFYVGVNGSGALMKLFVNLLGGLNRMVLAEALSLCKKAGLNQRLLLQILTHSPHHSKSMEIKGAKMVEKDFLPAEGKLAFHLKDVGLILDLGRKLNFPLPLSSLHAQALTSEVAKGKGDWDNTDIISFYEDLGNL